MSVPQYPQILEVPFAIEGDKTNIPVLTEVVGKASLTEGFPLATQQPVEAGGVPPSRLDFNGILNLLSQTVYYLQRGGLFLWSSLLDYPSGSKIIWNGIEYLSLQENGSNTALGIVEPGTNISVWQVVGQNSLLYPSAFVTLYEQSPPSGFYVRNGGLITNADTTVPKLWEALQKPENAWKCKTQAQWTALSNATPWSGIGGVPFFVVDTSAKTIRLPDTRGMHEEGSGFDSLIVGGVKKDMVRNMTGAINNFYTTAPWNASSVGILKYGRNDFSGVLNTTVVNAKSDLSIDISLQVPTGPVNRPRSFGVLHCVYAGIQE